MTSGMLDLRTASGSASILGVENGLVGELVSDGEVSGGLRLFVKYSLSMEAGIDAIDESRLWL